MIGLFLLGILVGIAVETVASFLWVGSKFQTLRDKPCGACGRPSAVIAQIVDLETRQPRAMSVLCEACANHAKNATAASPAPWAHTWK